MFFFKILKIKIYWCRIYRNNGLKNIKEEKNSAWEEKERREIGEERVSDTSSNRGLSDERPTHVVSVLRPLLIPSIAARLGTTLGQKNNTRFKRYFLPVQLYVLCIIFHSICLSHIFSYFYLNNIFITYSLSDSIFHSYSIKFLSHKKYYLMIRNLI